MPSPPKMGCRFTQDTRLLNRKIVLRYHQGEIVYERKTKCGERNDTSDQRHAPRAMLHGVNQLQQWHSKKRAAI